MIASAVTVIAAMLAMLAGVLGLNRTLGPVNAIGIAIVLLASLTLLPAVLAVAGERAFWPGRPDAAEKAGGVWQRLGERVRRRPLAVARGGRAAARRRRRRASRSTSCTADWIQQFKNETDGTRGYDVLKTGFPPGALAPTTALLERSDGPVTPADVAAVQERLRASPGVAAGHRRPEPLDRRARSHARLHVRRTTRSAIPRCCASHDIRASLEAHGRACASCSRKAPRARPTSGRRPAATPR